VHSTGNLRLCDPREFFRDGKILDSGLVGPSERTERSSEDLILFGGEAAEARARKVNHVSGTDTFPTVGATGGRSKSGGPISVTRLGQSTKRPVPILLVEYANPWSIFANSDFSSKWRASYDLVRTHFINTRESQ